MNTKQKLFLSLAFTSVASFLFASLFVILYFRIFPNRVIWLFPAALVAGVIVGILYYPAVRAFLDKKEE